MSIPVVFISDLDRLMDEVLKEIKSESTKGLKYGEPTIEYNKLVQIIETELLGGLWELMK